jgi:hypothetical protein
MTQEVYSNERTLLTEIEQNSADQHDKAILQLTMAALGVSIAFVSQVAPRPLLSPEWLVISWGAFVGSIIAILASFHGSQAACRLQRELIDQEYEFQTVPADQSNKYIKRTIRLSLAAYFAFVVGVLALLVFCYPNLIHAQKNDQPPANHPATKEKADGRPSSTTTKTAASPPSNGPAGVSTAPVPSSKPTTTEEVRKN